MRGLASPEKCPVTHELARAMTYRMYGVCIASLSVVALMLASGETFAGSGAVHGGRFTSTHSIPRAPLAQSFRHHRRNNVGTLWPAVGGFLYAPSNGDPALDVTQPRSRDMHYTYTHDVPWDWAHRYPPIVAPSQRPYVPSCPAETLTVPGHGGKQQTVSIMRCY
jgi:hypothetical protein